MKTTYYLLLALLITSACSKSEKITEPAADSQYKKDLQTLNSFLEEFKSPSNEFTVNPAVGGIFTTLKGSRIYIKPNAFKRADGSLPTGTVKLHVRDLVDAADMLLHDKPSVTDYNAMLISYCELYLSAREGTNKLQVNSAVPDAVVAKVPLPNDSEQDSIPVWYGDTSFVETLTGLNHDAQPVTVTKPAIIHRGVVWEEAWGRTADIIPNATPSERDTITYTINHFDVWLNCDQLNFDPRPRTRLFCYFNSNFSESDTTDTEAPLISYVYFKPKDRNILVKCANPILKPIPGKEGFYSEENLTPVGLEAKFIAFSIKDGKYFAEVKAATVPAILPGKTYSTISFDPVEVSKNQLITMINSLSNF